MWRRLRMDTLNLFSSFLEKGHFSMSRTYFKVLSNLTVSVAMLVILENVFV
jgi:hypothetical protein